MAERKGTVDWVPIQKIKAVGWGGAVLFIVAAVLSQVNEETLSWAGTWQAPLGAGVTGIVALIAGYLKFDPDVFQKNMPGHVGAHVAEMVPGDEEDADGSEASADDGSDEGEDTDDEVSDDEGTVAEDGGEPEEDG